MTAEPKKRLANRTLFVSGASRGIGLAIAKAAAAEGANIAIAAKTDEPHPKLPGTIHTAAKEIENAAQASGRALPLVCDIRFEEQVAAAVDAAAARFGGIDCVINNASAISLTGTEETDLKRYDLMAGINSRGAFLVTKTCLPHLLKSDRAHILTLAPPLDFAAKWFGGHAAYSLAKYGMSMLSLGWSAEFAGRIASNCLWPRTTIDTAAVRNLLGGEAVASASRAPAIMGDAAVEILTRGPEFSGWFCLDDLVLAAAGVADFDRYAVTPGAALREDFFIPRSAPSPEEAGGTVGWRAPEL